MSLGVYPDVTLKQAREQRYEARKLLAAEIDPSQHRKARKAVREERASNSFEVVARRWYAKQPPTWVDSHGVRILRRLERDIFPWLGKRSVAEITAPSSWRSCAVSKNAAR